MNNLRLDFEWEDPQGAKGPELRATWARFEIRIDSQKITEVFDQRLKSVREGLYLPLYPLAEWVAMHWWHLLFENAAGGRSSQSSYPHRHNFRYAREGFALPDLEIRPAGRNIVFDWKTTELRNCQLRFLRSGVFHVERDEARGVLTDFIEAVVERLEAQGIEKTLLQEEWSAIRQMGEEEADFCKSAATLGLNPYDLDDEEQDRILRVDAMLPAELSRAFFEAADSSRLEAQARVLSETLEAIRSTDFGLRHVPDLRGRITGISSVTPWNEGYAFARELRKNLGFQRAIFRSTQDLFRKLKDGPDLDTAIHRPDSTRLFDALVTVNRSGSPTFAIDKSKSRDAAFNFAFCRVLFEYLHAKNDAPAMATRAETGRQKRNRAFAAEFLAPIAMLEDRLSSNVVGEDEVDELANEFSVSAWVVNHQLENNGFEIRRD